MSQKTLTFLHPKKAKFTGNTLISFSNIKWTLETAPVVEGEHILVTITVTLSELMSIYFTAGNTEYYCPQETNSFTASNATVTLDKGVYKTEVKLTDVHLADPTLFLEKCELHDIAFSVEEQTLHLNKTLLALASDVFKKMLFGDFQESTAEKIVLQGKSVIRFIDFLSSFYDVSNPHSRLNFLRAINLYPLFQEYMMENYVDYCEQIFETKLSAVGTDNCSILKIACLVEKFDVEHLLTKCVELLASKNSSKFKKEENWMSLPKHVRYKVLDKFASNFLR